MENCSFQSQVLSVMEILAKAAVAEINRSVDDSCAVLRLELSQSRRDIDLLKRKCELMEAELRRSRTRARRKVLSPPAAERFSPLVSIILNKERQCADWDVQADAETQNQPQQPENTEPTDEAEHMQIKEERAEDDVWKKNPEDKLTENPAASESLVSPADGYNAVPEEEVDRNQDETEAEVKREEESDENAAPLDSGCRFVTEGDAQLWSNSGAGDSSFSYAGQQFEQIPTVFTSDSSLHLQDMVPRIHPAAKSVVVSAARVKRRVRTFGFKRPQPDEGHTALSQLNSIHRGSLPQQSQQVYRDSAPHTGNPGQDLVAPSPPASSLRGCSRSSFCLARRMRPPWTSSTGEKRFSCSYCDKSFMRFSQLKEHLRSHTGEKPFSCLQCGRSFTKQCNLIRHAVVHSGEKPYECSLCGKCFTQRSSLKSHQKTAH